jgi:hypothetical protein
MQCLAITGSEEGAAALSDAELAALVAEFIRLHAEEKHIKDRLDAVKEQLKRHAASQPRIANAVTLRTGEHASIGKSKSLFHRPAVLEGTSNAGGH